MPKLNFSFNLQNTITNNLLKLTVIPTGAFSIIRDGVPVAITGSFGMLFLMVFRNFPEKFSLGIIFSIQTDYRSNTIRR